MAFLNIENVHIAGISVGVSKEIIRNTDEAFIESTGVVERRGPSTFTTSDLGIPAAEKLISDLRWERSEIDAILFVSHTADYVLPATACILQDKLGLPKGCYASDISIGCSGWIYGLSMLASMISNGRGASFRHALLFAGDSKTRVPNDNPLFGAACSVTALEYKEGAKPMFFEFGTDGSSYDAIIIPDGGARNGISLHSFDEYELDGHTYNRLQLRMNGVDVFSFGISAVPQSIRSLSSYFGLDYLSYDYYLFHQANQAIVESIVRKLKIDPYKVPMSISLFGNTSSASIPLTIVTQLKGKIEKIPTKMMCCGFGVGFSWGSVAFETEDLVISDLVELG